MCHVHAWTLRCSKRAREGLALRVRGIKEMLPTASLLIFTFNAVGGERTARQPACFVKGLSKRAAAGHVSGVGRSRSGDTVYHLFCLLKH